MQEKQKLCTLSHIVQSNFNNAINGGTVQSLARNGSSVCVNHMEEEEAKGVCKMDLKYQGKESTPWPRHSARGTKKRETNGEEPTLIWGNDITKV